MIYKSLLDLTDIYPNLNILPIDNYIEFYKNLDTFSFSDSDIFIIDIDLNFLHTGIDYAKKIRTLNNDCFIIFLTADDQKGIEIINQHINATTYLLKESFDQTTLKKKLKNEIVEIRSKITESHGQQYLSVKIDQSLIMIKIADILYIETVKNVKKKLFLKTTTEEFLISATMQDLKTELLSIEYMFTELKSFIINLNAIASMNPQEGQVVFKNGEDFWGGRKVIKKIHDAWI